MERTWYLTKPSLQHEVDEHGSVKAAAEHHGVPVSTVQSAARRLGVRSKHPKVPYALTQPANTPPKHGVTYVIEAVGQGLFKIGRTSGEPSARLQQLRNTSPTPLELVLVLGHPLWEVVLHHHYREQRQHGEWFVLTPADLRTLRLFESGA
jgi:hypothetical protein